MPKPNAKEQAYMSRVAKLPCCACGVHGVQLHHVRALELGSGMGLKAPHHCVIPLCHICHDRFHRIGRREWENRYGRQAEHVIKTQEKAGWIS